MSESVGRSLVEPRPGWIYALTAQQLGFDGEDILNPLVLAEHVAHGRAQSLQSVTLFRRL
jgi:hypothetical protein